MAAQLLKVLNRDGIRIYGPLDPSRRNAVVAFSVEGVNHHDVAGFLDEMANIFVRSGMHCTHLFHHAYLKSPGTVRASLYVYNTKAEIELFGETLERIIETFA